MAEKQEKSKSGAGKFFLGAAIGAAVGAIASKFIKFDSSEEEVESGCGCDDCDCENCDCGKGKCDCKDCDCGCEKEKKTKEPAKETKKTTEKKTTK